MTEDPAVWFAETMVIAIECGRKAPARLQVSLTSAVAAGRHDAASRHRCPARRLRTVEGARRDQREREDQLNDEEDVFHGASVPGYVFWGFGHGTGRI